MLDSFEIFAIIPANPKEVYSAWLDIDAHTNMTGGRAEASPAKGATFTAWDGYILGTNLELEANHRIVQAWRTSEFPDGSADSRLEVVFEESGWRNQDNPPPQHDSRGTGRLIPAGLG